MRDAEAEIRDLLDTQARALQAGDVAGVMAPYAEDIVLFDLPPPLQVTADPGGLQDWIDGWDMPPTMRYRDMTISVSGDLAAAHGFIHTTVQRDGESGGYWARGSWIFRRSETGWKITHHHNSVPFYMDDSQRAALDLEPGSGPARIF
ncbi:YybH family protein [Paracoccus aerodenitrificans]|uniref:YybH family protein n=1 Tax=Paracoccus aerodenitrificans TaxID=3017781 RepID=UPI0022F10643|nr:nuclear transport factor 2 family protein [Paracoccus aerodenitrificans]WBU64068.1 nuclear transport factor 2 family protein [Paracoccus aerodenitrificans]